MAFHDSGQGIATRIKAVLDAKSVEASIFFSPSLEYVYKNSGQFYPAVHVVYLDCSIDDQAAEGFGTLYTQNWAVIICVKNPHDSIESAMDDVDVLIDPILKGLQGYQLSSSQTPLRPVTPRLAKIVTGNLYYPFEVQTKLPVKGER